MALFEDLDRMASPDISIVCSDGVWVDCHKIILISFSPFVGEILKQSESDIIIAPDIKSIDLIDLFDVSYGVKTGSCREEGMKNIFKIFGVDPRGICVSNVMFEFENIKFKRQNKKRGWVQLKYRCRQKKTRKVTQKSEKLAPETFIPQQSDISEYLMEEQTTQNYDSGPHLASFSPGTPDNDLMQRKVNLEGNRDHDYLGHSASPIPVIKNFKCEECGKACKSKRGLTKHLLIKHGLQSAEIVVGSKLCQLCGGTFKRHEIAEHMKVVHPESKGERCKFCDVEFQSKSKLLRHMIKHNPKEDEFNCEHCDFSSGSEESFKGHMRRHNTSFQCALCDYMTSNKTNLSRHHTHVHKEIVPTPFQCNKCD